MEEKDIIEKIQKLSQIKLSEEEKSFIFKKINEKIAFSGDKRGALSIFSFLRVHKVAFTLASILIFIFSTFAFASNSLPDSPLYPLKMTLQEARISLAKKENKPQLKVLVLKERLEDLKKVQKEDSKVLKVVNNLKEDLKTLPNEITQINKKREILKTSQNVQLQTQKMKEEAEKITFLEKTQLKKTLEETNEKILSLILETTDQINRCPDYLSKNLSNLNSYFEDPENIKNLTPQEILKVKTVLSEIDQMIKAGDCLGALEKIESLSKFQSIHSLEINSVENNISLESLDEN